ncbi:hypothetical protein Tco_0026578 [Tanacetum coccineum]
MEGIEDLIPNLWCSRITAYEKDALLGIKHWRSQRQQFYRAMIKKPSKHKVFSKLRILSVIRVTVDMKWGYSYLKEIVVKRADQKHYTFKECDFSALHLSDIEDMLLLIAQQKINNLDGDVIVDFVSALKMFTRSIVVQNRVGDIQLGVESYQRKLNLLKPQRTCPDIEPFSLEETSVVTMADQRTMAELLQAPTEGYGDAIVIPAILAENFELKHGLLNLVTSKQFYGFEKEDPHAHIRWFNKITSTIKYKDVPNSSIKLMLFPFSIEGAARIWLEKEPPRSILTWEDLVSKFINQFFPPSKTTNL